jgi:hypothetical protein
VELVEDLDEDMVDGDGDGDGERGMPKDVAKPGGLRMACRPVDRAAREKIRETDLKRGGMMVVNVVVVDILGCDW